MSDTAIVVDHAAPSRDYRFLWILEEFVVAHDLRLLRLGEGDHKRAGCLAANPMGKAPAIVHRGVTVTETSAICLGIMRCSSADRPHKR